MAINVLLRLLMAHLLGDFLFQRDNWVKAKEKNKAKAPELYYHVAVVTVLTYLLLWDFSKWYLPLFIMITHFLIDLWKCYRPNNMTYFLVDQGLHALVIILVWAIFYFNYQTLTDSISRYLTSTHLWTLILAYYFVSGPIGLAIGKATAKWQKDAGMDTGGLSKAGMWIGRCERIMVITFILLGQYTALGFLMTAKSILRFGDKEERQQKKTEYILAGTLISFASAAIVGAVAHYVLTTW